MSAGNAPRFVFIDRSGANAALTQRERELQRAQARAHAARVSYKSARAGTTKHGTSRKPNLRLSTPFGVPNVLALRPVLGHWSRRRKLAQDSEEDHDYFPPTLSLGVGQVDPFDTAPVKGLDNFVYSILDFGTYPSLMILQ